MYSSGEIPVLDFKATVPAFLRRQVSLHGQRDFVVTADSRLGYLEAERESARLARGLLAAGLGKGSRVGLLAPNGPAWVVAWLAVARLGALLVPLNTFSKARELGWMLRHADVQLLLCVDSFLGHDYLARLEEAAPSLTAAKNAELLLLPELPMLRRVYAWGAGRRKWLAGTVEELAESGDVGEQDDGFFSRVEDSVETSDPMLVVYSSGSTADPKGAVHGQGSLLLHAFNLNTFRGLRADDRLYSPMPFFWVGGFVFALLAAMHAGSCLLCEDSFEPGRTLDLLEHEGATFVTGWPHYGKAMADHESFAGRDLSSLRGGNVYDLLPQGVAPEDPELRANSLGMTETGGPHTMYDMTVDLPDSLRGSFGCPVPGLEHKLVDPDSGLDLAGTSDRSTGEKSAGEAGEICVRGYSLMQGLYKQPRDNVFDEAGWYHTGDGGSFNEQGHLFFEGRLGDVIKTGGANVSPREVEVLLEAVDGVKAAHVVGLPDPDRGQTVAAAVLLKQGVELDGEQLLAALRDELSAYKLPRQIFFLGENELPMTDSGKIKKSALAGQLQDLFKAGRGGA